MEVRVCRNILQFNAKTCLKYGSKLTKEGRCPEIMNIFKQISVFFHPSSFNYR